MNMKRVLLMGAVAVTLTACGQGGVAEKLAQDNKGPEAAAETFFTRCIGGVSLEDRMKTWSIAQVYMDKTHPGVQTPIFDCPPQDGVPDFTPQDAIDKGLYQPPK